MAIERFSGDHFFLSNMYTLKVLIWTEDGWLVETSEHAYQAAKFDDPEARLQVVRAETGKDAKSLAHELEDRGVLLRADWEVAKLGIMLKIVRAKFHNNPDIAELLIATGEEELVEGNDWGDRFWGVDPVGSRNGLNQLGQILMNVRAELSSTSD